MAEIAQQTFELQHRELLGLKRHNARLFGTIEEAVAIDAPYVGKRREKILQYEETHRMPSQLGPNYISNHR